MYSAYLDRFTNSEEALLIVESLHKEFHVAQSFLPAESTRGTWFVVEVQDDEITSIAIDIEKTNEMKEKIGDRMARLQSKKKSKFKRR